MSNRISKLKERAERRQNNEKLLQSMGLGKYKDGAKPTKLPTDRPTNKTGVVVYLIEYRRRRERLTATLESINRKMDELRAIASEQPTT